MSDFADEHERAGAPAALELLDGHLDALRRQLAGLRSDLDSVRKQLGQSREEELQEANEKLVMAVREADAIAEAAVGNLLRTRDSALGPLAAQRDAGAPDPAYRGADRRTADVERTPKMDDLREANQQLVLATLHAQESEAQAKAAHRQQITFMAMVAHELRNPLTPIRLAADLLVRRSHQSKIPLARLTAIIEAQVAHMARLVDDLLDGSRVSTGKLRLEFDSVDLVGVINQAIETCRPAMDARRQRMTVRIPPGPIMFRGDAIRLAQVFGNLLDNASKYTSAGGEITLAVDVLDDAITVTVADNGIGISAEALPSIFVLFVQDERGLAHAGGGLGIGLAVVRELVDAHGGSIRASSRGKDLGSEFLVTLPLTGGRGV
jgi:diguanylate cyclase